MPCFTKIARVTTEACEYRPEPPAHRSDAVLSRSQMGLLESHCILPSPPPGTLAQAARGINGRVVSPNNFIRNLLPCKTNTSCHRAVVKPKSSSKQKIASILARLIGLDLVPPHLWRKIPVTRPRDPLQARRPGVKAILLSSTRSGHHKDDFIHWITSETLLL
jgi:hypothetical protein